MHFLHAPLVKRYPQFALMMVYTLRMQNVRCNLADLKVWYFVILDASICSPVRASPCVRGIVEAANYELSQSRSHPLRSPGRRSKNTPWLKCSDEPSACEYRTLSILVAARTAFGQAERCCSISPLALSIWFEQAPDWYSVSS